MIGRCAPITLNTKKTEAMINVSINYNKRQWDFFRTEGGRVRRSIPNLPGVQGVMAREAAILNSKLWMELGTYAIKVVTDRLRQGIGPDDGPMPALKLPRGKKLFSRFKGDPGLSGYPKFKQKLGLKPIRDLVGPHSDHMLDGVRVNYVDESSCTLDITQRELRNRARGNQKAYAKAGGVGNWFSLSPSDRVKIMAKFRELFKRDCSDLSGLWMALGLISSRKFGVALGRAA